MGFAIVALAWLSPGCMEPPKSPQMDTIVGGLAYLNTWDKDMRGKGQINYDQVVGYGPDILPHLVAHLVDETPTAIYEEMTRRNPKVSDLCLLILLDMLKLRWQDFSDDGLFISTALPNQVFCIRWERPAKFKIQAKLRKLVEELDPDKSK